MHELGIAEALLQQVRAKLGEDLPRAVRVHVQVGADLRVVDDSLEQSWAVACQNAGIGGLGLELAPVDGGEVRVVGVTFGP